MKRVSAGIFLMGESSEIHLTSLDGKDQFVAEKFQVVLFRYLLKLNERSTKRGKEFFKGLGSYLHLLVGE